MVSIGSNVLSMYTGAKTVVRTVYGNSNGFEVESFAICDCHLENSELPYHGSCCTWMTWL